MYYNLATWCLQLIPRFTLNQALKQRQGICMLKMKVEVKIGLPIVLLQLEQQQMSQLLNINLLEQIESTLPISLSLVSQSILILLP
jgi:hypothetical protein